MATRRYFRRPMELYRIVEKYSENKTLSHLKRHNDDEFLINHISRYFEIIDACLNEILYIECGLFKSNSSNILQNYRLPKDFSDNA